MASAAGLQGGSTSSVSMLHKPQAWLRTHLRTTMGKPENQLRATGIQSGTSLSVAPIAFADAPQDHCCQYDHEFAGHDLPRNPIILARKQNGQRSHSGRHCTQKVCSRSHVSSMTTFVLLRELPSLP